MFSAELPWCLLFVQKIQLSGKAPIFIGNIITYRETHGTERGDGVAARGSHTLAGRGQGWARALLGCGHLGHSLRSPLDYLRPFTKYLMGDSSYFAKHIYAPPPTLSRFRGSEVPFWHPAGTGIRKRSSPSSSSPPLHRPSMIHPSMCE